MLSWQVSHNVNHTVDYSVQCSVQCCTQLVYALCQAVTKIPSVAHSSMYDYYPEHTIYLRDCICISSMYSRYMCFELVKLIILGQF